MNAPLKTCPSCGKPFAPWRSKAFCSEPCRKRAENGRLRGSQSAAGIIPSKADPFPLTAIPTPVATTASEVSEPNSVWVASNEVTRRLARSGRDSTPDHSQSEGWAIKVEMSPGREAGFGRIGKDFSFGPSSESRVKAAVEARLYGEPFEKHEGERSWSGTCWGLLGGSGAPDGAVSRIAPPAAGEAVQ
jgi:hypothetical protein